jgi:hypothetical protein
MILHLPRQPQNHFSDIKGAKAVPARLRPAGFEAANPLGALSNEVRAARAVQILKTREDMNC